MEIKIKNTTGEKKRAIIFGHYDDCWEGKMGYVSQPSFFDLKTDDGIEIQFDGDTSLEYRREYVKDVHRELFNIKSIEFTSNLSWNTTHKSVFKTLVIDANGAHLFKDVFLQMFFSADMPTEYPLILTGDRNIALRSIDMQTSYLLVLNQNEEITLKINTEKK